MSSRFLVCLILRVGAFILATSTGVLVAAKTPEREPLYEIERSVASGGFEGKMCWVHARAGAVPPGTTANPGENPLVVMSLQRLQLSGSDVFFGLNGMRTADLGATWSPPDPFPSFARRPFSWRDLEGLQITVSDFWPKWHAASGKLLGTGHTVVYEGNAVRKVRPRETAWAVYDPGSHSWSPWKTVSLPDEPRFAAAGAGSAQRVDLENGEILLPISFRPIDGKRNSVTILRCTFDGESLQYREHGSELTVPVKRGLYEPSLAHWKGRYYLTTRNDDHGYIARSDDGLHYSEPKRWTFDDGTDLGNYNTQQHWVVHSDALFLVYTRRGADNDHVFRHRAPLFIARVDPEKLHVIRASEEVLVPEYGARLGNFGVTEVDEGETWITAAEWMQGPAPHHHDPQPLVERGADNRIWVAKLKWSKPNQSFRP